MANVKLYPGKPIQVIADRLIRLPDCVLGPVALATIAYLFREETKKRNGRPVLWEMKKASEEVRGLADQEFDLICIVPAGEWEKLDEMDREALVHEALCSVVTKDGKDGETTFSVQKPDFQGYRENWIRYGAWRDDITEAKNVLNSEAIINVELGFSPSDATQPTAEA